jgi:hypothetical protein
MTEKTAEVAVQEFLKSLKTGEKQYKDGLTVIPLYSDIKSEYDYITMDEALKAEALKITEIGGGTVPEIRVLNKGKKDVFIMDGEQLVGAKQNRIVNISLVVPAESEINIPVSCVEQGRWHHTSTDFYASDNISYANLRKKHKASVMHSMERQSDYHADQGEVWEDIACFMSKRNVASPTAAMSDIYEKEKSRIADYKDIFKHVEGQIGAIFAIGKTIFGMDIFDKEDTCKKLMPKITNSYVMEILAGKTEKQPDSKNVEEFLKAVAESQFTSHKSPGTGMTVSITGKTAGGTSLVAKDTVVHTAVFNKPEHQQQKEKPVEDVNLSYLSNPSRRRNFNISED